MYSTTHPSPSHAPPHIYTHTQPYKTKPQPPPNVPLMAEALLHDLGLLLPPPPPPPPRPTTAAEDEGGRRGALHAPLSHHDAGGRRGDAKGRAVLECCLRFWARAQRCVDAWACLFSAPRPHTCLSIYLYDHHPPPQNNREAAPAPAGDEKGRTTQATKRRRWWARVVREMGGAWACGFSWLRSLHVGVWA